MSHDVRANFIQFYFLTIKSRNGLIYVAVYSHLYRIVLHATCVGERRFKSHDLFAKYDLRSICFRLEYHLGAIKDMSDSKSET